jgi:hypothetical protein
MLLERKWVAGLPLHIRCPVKHKGDPQPGIRQILCDAIRQLQSPFPCQSDLAQTFIGLQVAMGRAVSGESLHLSSYSRDVVTFFLGGGVASACTAEVPSSGTCRG